MMGSCHVTDNSQAFIDAAEEAIKAALDEIGEAAENYAKKLCPVKTGRLRASINYSTDGQKTVYIGSDVSYAPDVELGHRTPHGHTAPKPYLRPALEDHLNAYKKMALDELKG